MNKDEHLSKLGETIRLLEEAKDHTHGQWIVSYIFFQKNSRRT